MNQSSMVRRFESPKVDVTLTEALLKRLVRIPSVNPAIEKGNGEQIVASFIAEWFRKTRRFEVYEQRVTRDRFNVIAILARQLPPE